MERSHGWACLLKASRSILCFVCGKFKCYLCLWLRGNHAALQDYAALAWGSSCRQEAEGNDFNLSVAGSRLLCERSSLVGFVSGNLCQSAQCGVVHLHHINRRMKYKTRNTISSHWNIWPIHQCRLLYLWINVLLWFVNTELNYNSWILKWREPDFKKWNEYWNVWVREKTVNQKWFPLSHSNCQLAFSAKFISLGRKW